MELVTKHIAIPTFVNPHLFWIIESSNDERSKTLNHINKLMQDEVKRYELSLNHSFEVGEIVAVSLENKFYRAIIEDIPNAKIKQKKSFCFLCWLVDYGTMYESKVVYKLPDFLRKFSPLAVQASLNNVAYVQESLNFDQISGQPVKIKASSATPTSAAHQVSLQLISNLGDLQFQIENKVNGVFLGDVLYKENQEVKSLRQSLIDRGILAVEETLFKEIQENIYTYKESHLWIIAQICKKLNSLQFLKETKHNSFKNIISKYLLEFEENDIFDDDEIVRNRPVISRWRRYHNESEQSANSTSESISDIDTNKYENSSKCKVKSPRNRVQLLLEKLKEQKQIADKAKCTSSNGFTDDSFEKDYDTSSTNSKEQPSELKSSVRSQDISVNNKEDNLSASNLVQECRRAASKKMVPRNAVFVPGGANFSLAKVKKVTTRKPYTVTTKNHKISSEGESSDCKSVNVKNEITLPESTPSDEMSANEDSNVISQEVEGFPAKQLQIKPYCTCKQCEHWTTDNDWQKDINFLDDSKQLKHLTVVKPQTLFVANENTKVDRAIISLNYSSKTKLQKQAMPKLLVHGEYAQAPIRLVSEVCFHECIQNSLRNLKYEQAKRIQMYAWPAILRQQHVLMVNGPQTGKTLAYLPVILTFLLEKNERYEHFLSKSVGPIVIVLCANTKKCEEIYDLSRILLGKNRSKISLVTYPFSYINVKNMDMLITTPAVLMDLMKMNAITFKRLCHLILEDGDRILKQESEVMTRVFNLTQSMLCNRIYPKPVQLVICAEHWTLRLENLIQKLSSVPLICIGNHLESGLYGKMQFSMRFINSACKEHELKNLLKDTFRISKSIILCKNEEIQHIQTILMLKGIEATVITEDMSKEDILYLEEVWTQCHGGEYRVLVCTDFLLNTLLTVTSASFLIHFSLPSSWTQFVKRFGCLLENCKSPFDNRQTKMKCQSVVLCDEKCEGHMSKFFKFIDNTELKIQLPEKFQRFSESLKDAEEQKKLADRIGICGNLKLFGACSNTVCPWRHVIHNESDICDYLPQSGKIKFKIIYIHDVTSYSVQIIQHIDVENQVHEFTKISDITEDLTDIIKISRKQIIKPVVGHLYAYYDIDNGEGAYYRCELLELDGDCVRIKLVDKGDIIRTVKNRLYKLSKEFKIKPRKIIDVYLANFIPPYQDKNFSAKSFFNLKNLLEKHDYKNMIMTADIHLQLGNSLWLKNVNEEVELSDKIVPRFQLTREILVSKLAEYNNNQLNSLYKLCKEASISLPIYETPVKKAFRADKKIEPQWAHLDSEVNEVTFSAAISPDEIYVRLNKFNQQLYNLQKEIQDSLKKPNYPKLHNIEKGTICLAKDPEGIDYARTVITNIENDKALCFFVDFGDEAIVDISELKYIHNKFITKLPFQTIQCKLHGIKPTLDDWQNDINDILYEYATEPNSDVFRLLLVKSCRKEKNEVHPNQNRYSVLLKDGFGEKHVLINNLLVDCGVAVKNSEEFEDFDVSTSFNSEESDEELEQIIDICRKTRDVEENFCGKGKESTKDDVNNEELELFLINPEEFFQSLLAIRDTSKAESIRELPAIQYAPPVDYCTPEVYWSQTEKYIKMDIRLSDVNQYELNLTKGIILKFKTVNNKKTYKLNIILFEKVSSVQHISMGRHIRVTLTKLNNTEWPRLTLSQQRPRNIHYDVSTIIFKEETKKILEFPDMSDEEGIEEDDIDIMYHVVSDLDSDLDAELQENSD